MYRESPGMLKLRLGDMETFRVLQLSDFHFCLEPNRHNYLSLLQSPRNEVLNILFNRDTTYSLYPASYSQNLAEGVASFVFERRDEIDLLLISGDLGTTGMTEDLSTAHDFMFHPADNTYLYYPPATLLVLKPTLEGSKRGIMFFAGNHDRYADNKGTPNSANFENVFSSELAARKSDPNIAILTGDGGEQIAFIAADFCLKSAQHAGPGTLSYYGQGIAYPQVVRDIVKKTKLVRKQHGEIPILWTMHFPPVSAVSTNLRILHWQRI